MVYSVSRGKTRERESSASCLALVPGLPVINIRECYTLETLPINCSVHGVPAGWLQKTGFFQTVLGGLASK